MTIDREKVLQAAQAFIQRKKYDRAVAEYRKLIQQDPDDARILLKIGDLQSKMEAHADAIATYERVGRQYARQGFALKAIAVYKQIREIIRKHVPDLAERYSHITPLLAELYGQLGLVSDAVAAYDEVAAQLQRAGQDAEAINVFKKLLALDATSPLPHLRLAEAYSRIHDNEGAITHFGAAANILADLGRYDDALKVLERLLHHRPDPTFARKAAEIYVARGQPNDGMLALPKLQICFQSNPKDLDTLALLAKAFMMIGQPARAIEVHKEIARIAKEQGNNEVFRRTVEALLRVAPADEAVRRLAASANDPLYRSSAPPAGYSDGTGPSEPPIALEDAEIQEVDEVRESMPSEIPLVNGRPAAAGSRSVQPTKSSVAPPAAHEDPNYLASADPQQILSEAESYCAVGLHARAIEHLERAILAQPDLVILRRKLRDIVYELGDFERTAEEMVQIAQIFIDQQAPEYAAEELQAIFTFMADHPVARQMLYNLGYAVPGDPEAEAAAAAAAAAAQAAQAPDPYAATQAYTTQPSGEAYGAQPSGEAYGAQPSGEAYGAQPSGEAYGAQPSGEAYGAQPSGEAYGAQRSAWEQGDQAAAQAYALQAGSPGAVEDPRGQVSNSVPAPQASVAQTTAASKGTAVSARGQVSRRADAAPKRTSIGPKSASVPAQPGQLDQKGGPIQPAQPLPAFPFPEEAQTAKGDVLAIAERAAEEEAATAAAPASAASAGTAPTPQAIEDALEEAEFFISRGLIKDARDILEEQLRRAPNHPMLRERVRELRGEAGGPSETISSSGTRERPLEQSTQAGPAFSAAPEPSRESASDRAFDIAASLDAIDALDHQSSFVAPNQQVDVEEVFAKFKKGVRAQISEGDSQTHYDLGLAYREMDLYADAVEEFDLAARDPKRECVCYSMVGMMHRAAGNLNAAIEAFIKGLHAEVKTPEQENKLYYELGDAYEAKRVPSEAVYFFKKIAHNTPDYQDERGSVAERLRALQASQAPANRPRAVNALDEFDAAFDAMLGQQAKR